MEQMDFLRLCDCSKSTRLGMVDRGFPRAMERLAALGYVKLVADGNKWPGHKTTKEGDFYIVERHRRERASKRTYRQINLSKED
jgi:hypothetical protein